MEILHDLCGSRCSAIAAGDQLLEEVAFPQGSHGDGEMRDALMRCERFGECDEGVSLIHAKLLACSSYVSQASTG